MFPRNKAILCSILSLCLCIMPAFAVAQEAPDPPDKRFVRAGLEAGMTVMLQRTFDPATKGQSPRPILWEIKYRPGVNWGSMILYVGKLLEVRDPRGGVHRLPSAKLYQILVIHRDGYKSKRF